MTVADDIASIGARLVGCTCTCAGVARNQEEGIVPRGLYMEAGEGNEGVIVCGMNPSKAEKPETAAYRQEGASYPVVLAFWNLRLRSIAYFSRARRFVRALGHSGSILWTDVAKCERSNPSMPISFATHPQTFRVCASSYLTNEIKVCPETWPLIANGKDAFTALSYLFPSRRVIGITHCTGAYPQFSRMWAQPHCEGELRDDIKRAIEELQPHGALWLPAIAK